MLGLERETVLVLGASGFLGPHLVHAARAAGAGRVVAASRSGALPGPPVEACEPVRLDAREAGALEGLLERERPLLVLNAAALARAADCEREPARARELNELLPARLGAACASRGVRLVHVSTDLVFGARPAPPGGFREEHPTAPLGVYGATKAAGERAVLAADPRALVARLPLLTGGSFGRGLGASDSLLAALARGERPPLFEDEWRTPLDAGDAAGALLELGRGELRGLLHLAGPTRMSRLELGLAVLASGGEAEEAARSRVRAARREDYTGPARAEDTSLDAERARAVLRAPLRVLADRPIAGR
jgi:dTDP-4-dehydrorhamnose reductase